MSITERAGRVLYFLAWPAFFVYFHNTERTRVILVHQGRMLVIKHWLSDGRWSLPGGGVQKGETPRVGVVRELYEETDVRIRQDQLVELGTGIWKAHGLRYKFRSYAVKLDHELVLQPRHVRVSKLEWLYLVWIRPAELLPNETSTDVLDSIRMLEKSHPDFLVQ